MSEFYDRMAATAVRQISEKGQTVTLTRRVAGAYNPATQTTGADTVTTWTVKAVEDQLNLFQQEGSLVQAGDRKMLIAPMDSSGAAISPVSGDVLTFGATDWPIVQSLPLAPGGIDLLFTVLLRRP